MITCAKYVAFTRGRRLEQVQISNWSASQRDVEKEC